MFAWIACEVFWEAIKDIRSTALGESSIDQLDAATRNLRQGPG